MKTTKLRAFPIGPAFFYFKSSISSAGIWFTSEVICSNVSVLFPNNYACTARSRMSPMEDVTRRGERLSTIRYNHNPLIVDERIETTSNSLESTWKGVPRWGFNRSPTPILSNKTIPTSQSFCSISPAVRRPDRTSKPSPWIIPSHLLSLPNKTTGMTSFRLTYNNAKQASTQMSPFYANYGYHPRMSALLYDSYGYS